MIRTPTQQNTDYGDCLFNAASLFLVGSETKSTELCYKTTIILVNKEMEIPNHKDKASLMDMCPRHERTILDSMKLGRFSAFWTINAMAKVISEPVKVIYPSVSGKRTCILDTQCHSQLTFKFL